MIRRLLPDIVIFAAILIAGLARLPEPFFGDQAVSALMGQIIAEGGVPYRDLWDLAHPGIFFFFALGGALFGFHELGIHAFELLWMLSLAIGVRLVAARYIYNPVAASLAPALTVGAYYALTTSYHVTQPEGIVGLPLLLSLVAVRRAVGPGCQHPDRWLFASGLCAGVVIVIHAPYILLPVAFVALAAMDARRHGHAFVQQLRRMAAPFAGGLLLPIAGTVMYLASKPGLALAWWTLVQYPLDAVAQGARNYDTLADGIVWFLRTFAVLLVLAGVGTIDRMRSRPDLLTRMLLAWGVGGAAIIWLHVLSWWSYQYVLLVVPVGLLASQGVATLWSAAVRPAGPSTLRALSAATLLVLAVLFVRQLVPITGLVVDILATRPWPTNLASMHAFHAARNSAHADDLATVAFLREPSSEPGPIYAFAMPNLYHASGRSPAVPFLAAWFPPTVELWERLIRELDTAAPPYILVNDHELDFIVKRNPAVADAVSALRGWLEAGYDELQSGVGGTWYVRRAPRA